jgi:hypothetical protein
MGERRATHRLGKRLVEGAHLRSTPPFELPWITTFNLRWLRHAEKTKSRRRKGPAGKTGLPG